MRTNHTEGFTLIEILVIAPIVILFIGAFVGLIVSLTGDSLQMRTSNEVSYQVQNALDTIEAENARSSENYPTTTGALTSPQGLNNDTTAFTVTNNDASNTDNDVLIIKSPATTLDPVNPGRSLIRYNSPNACAATNVSDNPYYSITTVFFVASSTLWQRTILPSTGTPCATPWQKASCAESQAIAGVCKTYDSKLADNVTSFSVQYLNSNGSNVSAGSASQANAVKITINANKLVAGKTVAYSGSLRSDPLNVAPQVTQAVANYSDDFTGTGALGNIKTGTPTLAWQFMNSTSANWSRNSTGYASSTTAASSNPMAIADFGAYDVAITEGVRSTGNAIYFRVSDSNNWLRTRVNQTSTFTPSGPLTYESYGCYGTTSCSNTAYGSSLSSASAAMSACASQLSGYAYTGGCNTYQTSQGGDTTYTYYLILDKSVSGTVTQLGSTTIGSTMPAYISVTAKGSAISTAYGSTSSTTSSGNTATETANQTATKHGIGYATSSSGSVTGVKTIAIVNAP